MTDLELAFLAGYWAGSHDGPRPKNGHKKRWEEFLAWHPEWQNKKPTPVKEQAMNVDSRGSYPALPSARYSSQQIKAHYAGGRCGGWPECEECGPARR